MEIKHTPTPWKANKSASKKSNFGNYSCRISHLAADENQHEFYETVADAKGGYTDDAQIAEANAAFIVRACNAHQAILGAMDKLAAIVTTDAFAFEVMGNYIEQPTEPNRKLVIDMLEDVARERGAILRVAQTAKDAALAKAEGK